MLPVAAHATPIETRREPECVLQVRLVAVDIPIPGLVMLASQTGEAAGERDAAAAHAHRSKQCV